MGLLYVKYYTRVHLTQYTNEDTFSCNLHAQRASSVLYIVINIKVHTHTNTNLSMD